MKYVISILLLFSALCSCSEKKNKILVALNKIDSVWLDSIVKASDTSYNKPYKRTDFVTAYFYVNRKDSSVCQVMKDSFQQIRQVLISKKNIRTHFSQYYPNGQLMAFIKLDSLGQNNDTCVYYFQDGSIKSKGLFKAGLYSGEWKNYDENGNGLPTTLYDENGNIVR